MSCSFFDWKNGIKDDELTEVANILKNDGIVIFPTETVYGIAGNAFSEDAINKIYSAKERPRDKAINIMVSDGSKILKYAKIQNEFERRIIDEFMPGPITLILDKVDDLKGSFLKQDGTIGVRIPDNEIALSILKKIDFPIIAPSANISGMPSGVNINQIYETFKDKVDAIIDGGIPKYSEASTIVKVYNNEIKILRHGCSRIENNIKI